MSLPAGKTPLRLVSRPANVVEDIEIALLLEGIFRRYGFDFRGYARPSLRRRILECAREEKVRTVSLLQEKLLRDPQCFERLVTTISVNVTTLFRNPAFYRSLRRRVLPRFRARSKLRVWHMGCATGEEVYSASVLLHEEGLDACCRVYATDIHEPPLRRAARGAFPLDRLRAAEISYRAAGGRARLSDYYRVVAGEGVFRDDLRQNVVFAAHNPVTDASFNEFDVVLCRNLLPFLTPGLQGRIHRLVHDSLACPGFLGLGRGEDLRFTPYERSYRPVDAVSGLFEKVR